MVAMHKNIESMLKRGHLVEIMLYANFEDRLNRVGEHNRNSHIVHEAQNDSNITISIVFNHKHNVNINHHKT